MVKDDENEEQGKASEGDANQRKARGYGRNLIPEELRIGAPGRTKGDFLYLREIT